MRERYTWEEAKINCESMEGEMFQYRKGRDDALRKFFEMFSKLDHALSLKEKMENLFFSKIFWLDFNPGTADYVDIDQINVETLFNEQAVNFNISAEDFENSTVGTSTSSYCKYAAVNFDIQRVVPTESWRSFFSVCSKGNHIYLQ